MPIDVFEGVTAEVKMLVVPEGGELPPEEELGAMEAAEAEARPPPRPRRHAAPAERGRSSEDVDERSDEELEAGDRAPSSRETPEPVEERPRATEDEPEDDADRAADAADDRRAPTRSHKSALASPQALPPGCGQLPTLRKAGDFRPAEL